MTSMDPVSLTIGLSWIVTSSLCVALALPLIRGKVGRNALYGVRLPQAFASDEAWRAINRYGGKRLARWALPMIVVGIVALCLPLQANSSRALAVGLMPLAFIAIAVADTWRFARRYNRAK